MTKQYESTPVRPLEPEPIPGPLPEPARKDKGGKSSKKAASSSLKEKRQAMRDKTAAKASALEPL